MKSSAKFIHFHSRKCIWKCRLRKGVYLVSASMSQHSCLSSLTEITLCHAMPRPAHYTLSGSGGGEVSRQNLWLPVGGKVDNYIREESSVKCHNFFEAEVNFFPSSTHIVMMCSWNVVSMYIQRKRNFGHSLLNNINSLWPWGVIWWNMSGFTLPHVVDCCLRVQSHTNVDFSLVRFCGIYLWVINSEWKSWYSFTNLPFTNIATSFRNQYT